jgi:hypothetical protein
MKAEAWRAWERSLDENTRTKVRDSMWDGEIVQLREEMVTQGVGDTKYLDIVMKCIQERNRLRGLYEAKIAIKSEHKHELVIKAYQEISPSVWDDVVDGEVIEPLKLNGSN